ncbi:MAG: hypothetical protein WBL54_02410, partial [Nitrososphaeraceae archaeon]
CARGRKWAIMNFSHFLAPLMGPDNVCATPSEVFRKCPILVKQGNNSGRIHNYLNFYTNIWYR